MLSPEKFQNPFKIQERVFRYNYMCEKYPWAHSAVVKFFRREMINEYENERNILMKLNNLSSTFVKLYEYGQHENQFVLVLEDCAKGNLSNNLFLLEDERTRLWFFYKMLEALKIAHKNMITHRDIKLDNILVTENNEFKISDFDSSKCINHDGLQSFVGTLNYLSPAQIKNSIYLKSHLDPFANEMWALGLVFLEVCQNYNLKRPLISNCSNASEFNEELAKRLGRLTRISDQIKDLVARMLTFDGSKRITSKKALNLIKKYLFHPDDYPQTYNRYKN